MRARLLGKGASCSVGALHANFAGNADRAKETVPMRKRYNWKSLAPALRECKKCNRARAAYSHFSG